MENIENYDNHFMLEVASKSENEKFVRNVVANFVLVLSPTVEEVSDLKTAVSEAVTNSIVHAYPSGEGIIKVVGGISGKTLTISIEDCGEGIENIEVARQPFFTTKPYDERSGMGFSVMETFMDSVEVFNKQTEKGLVVVMKKAFGGNN